MTVFDFADPATLDVPGRRRSSFPEIEDGVFWAAYEAAAPFSMVHVTGFYNLYQSLSYIAANGVPGHLVECGCFLGGVGMFVAALRPHFGLAGRRLFLLDTFEGFPPGHDPETTLGGEAVRGHAYPNIRHAVEANLRTIVPDLAGIDLVEGPVERTVPALAVGDLALLRLDTDFYASTRVELLHLYPKLARGGVLIVDDYGFFQGSRRATDEFLASTPRPPLLNRIDATVWAGVRP